MKKLGIIGGAGPLASALLYETLVRECYSQGVQVPEILLINYPFTRCLTLEERKENANILHRELQAAIRTLEHHGVDLGLLACNTLHSFLKRLIPTEIPFLQLPELIIKEAVRKNHNHLLIVGTQNTCNQGLYDHPLISSIYPNIEEQQLIDHIIDHVLEGKICEEDSFLLSQIIALISKREKVEGTVLGCTDLPVLHHHYPIQSSVRLYDTIKLPVKSILRGLL
jgi:aspartate racemase